MAAPSRNADDVRDPPNEALAVRDARSSGGFEPFRRSGSDSNITEGMVQSFSCANSLSLFLTLLISSVQLLLVNYATVYTTHSCWCTMILLRLLV